jgi:2-methylcitrate dehydratase
MVMTVVQELAAFVERASYREISEGARRQLKLRVLDALGCALGALAGEPVKRIRAHVGEFSPDGLSTLIGGGKSAPDLAGFYNSALVRYLDFNDSYLAEGETCHPSDNLGGVLAAAEYAGASGEDFLTSLAIAYQVQCRLSDEAPVRARGFDHTTQGAYAASAGASRALGLSAAETAHAIAISGTAQNALRVTRTGALSNWKGLAYPNTVFGALHATFLARRGITGPLEVFEGNKGFMEAISGRFVIDWKNEDLERVNRTIIKKFNAEIHSQSALEGLLSIREEEKLDPRDVDRVEIDIFDVAYHIIGGGEEGDKTLVRTKEEADHSLQYLAAVALLDGEVSTAQFAPERIRRSDVQALLRKVVVRPSEEYSRRFPGEMPCRVAVVLRDGTRLVREKDGYRGFHRQPMDRDEVLVKFERLCEPFARGQLSRDIAEAVWNLESLPVRELTGLLGRVNGPAGNR